MAASCIPRPLSDVSADLDKIEGATKDDAAKDDKKDETAPHAVGDLVGKLKAALGEAVKDVRVSQRLTESAVCLIADENDVDINLERLLKQHQHLKAPGPLPRILEINPDHALIRRLADVAATADDESFKDAAHLLLDQARIMEGEAVVDPQAFARRLSKAMERGLAA